MAAFEFSVHQIIIPFSFGVHKVSLTASSGSQRAALATFTSKHTDGNELNSNHSLPNGGVARVEDHITLTTKRKPWRGPAKMSVFRLEGYKNQIAPVLPSRLKLMSKSERKVNSTRSYGNSKICCMT